MARSDRLPRLVLLAALAPAACAFACNLITGLGGYEKVDCVADCGGPDVSSPEAASVSGEGGFPADLDAGDAADAFVTLPDADGGPTPFERWTHWPMPNPRDAGADVNLASYAVDDAGTVTDQVTKLVWQTATSGPVGFEAARAYCASLSSATDIWRLPTRIELASLVDWTQTPAIDPAAFPEAEGGPFWTSSPVAFTDGGAFWSVDFDDGTVTSHDTSTLRRTRCVKETSW